MNESIRNTQDDERKRIMIMAPAISVALIFIVLGSMVVWKSFRTFEKAILTDKDNQFQQLILSEDANIQSSLLNYSREVLSMLNERKFKRLNDEALESGNWSSFRKYIDTSDLSLLSTYSGFVIYNDGKIVKSASDETSLKFLSKANSQSYRTCENSEGRCFLAYEEKLGGGETIYFLVGLENLINDTVGKEHSPDDMKILMDWSSSIVVIKHGERIVSRAADSHFTKDIDKCIAFVKKAQENGKNSARSIDMTHHDPDYSYVARIVVSIAPENANEVFAIAEASNYDSTIKPSRKAADMILIHGAIVVLGVCLILITLIVYKKRTHDELEHLRKRNEAMEEINQKVQALAHHQRLETIGTMTAGIAHDFNNLLTPIMGYSMMSMEMLPKDQTFVLENLTEVYNASVKAKDLVSRLADLSKNCNVELLTELDPDSMVKNSIKVSLPAKPKTVDVKTRLNCAGHYIKGDTTQISQLILNITLNAYDAMADNGGGTLIVSTSCHDGNVELKFKDDGPGMDSDTVSKIFDPFFTTKESGKGTGLGLAIVAQVAETHDAKLYVDSEPGVGTEFRIVFKESLPDDTLPESSEDVAE